MKQNPYSRRSAVEAKEKLAQILATRVADPALAQVTVTGCEVSVDRTLVRAFVACPAGTEDEVLAALGRAKGHLRALLGRALGWRVTPELDIRIDPTTEAAERITRALRDRPPTLDTPKDEDGYPLADPAGEDGDDAGAEPEPAEGGDGAGELP